MGEDIVKRYLLTAFVALAGLSLAAGVTLARGTLLAAYSLDQTAADQTGHYADATILNAPFEDGGVYLNGKYDGTDPDGSKVQTPGVTQLDFSSLSVRADFKISEWPAANRPILYCGASWRRMGANLTSSGHLYLAYNTIGGPASAETVALDVWHTLVMTYDGAAGHVFLDGVEVAVQVFTPNHGDDRRFVTFNGGNGTAFKGHLRNLAVYNGVISRDVGVAGVETPETLILLGNHPNPFNPSTLIVFSLPAPAPTTLSVFDLSGRLVNTLLDGALLGQGPHERHWNGTDSQGNSLPSGTYFYRLQAGVQVETRKMTLVQ